jgi:chromosome segregation ATPase
MIEPIMYVAIGFLVACMLVIGVIPVVHARAVRLTTRRLQTMTPMSMAEIQADKDQLRAEFAMTTRRLEMTVDQMKAKTTSQLAELGKKSEAIGRIKLELSEKTATLLALEAKEKQLSDDLQEAQRQRDEKAGALQETERLMVEFRSQLAATSATVNNSVMTVDSQRVELVTARAQTEVLRTQIERLDNESRELSQRLALEIAEVEATRKQLADEVAKSEALNGRVAELERQLVAQTTETEILGRRVQELLTQIEQQGHSLAERAQASDLLRNEGAIAEKTMLALRAEVAAAENRRIAATEAAEAERTALENQLKQSQAERDKLQYDLTMMRREMDATWTTQRVENAVLRERINDIAAEIARLTSTLEGPGSPIDKMLASDAHRSAAVALVQAGAQAGAQATTAGAGAAGTAANNGEGSPPGSLADRMRALQRRAAQAPQPGRA